MERKRVLMMNLYFERYTGSELHTLEMARLFEKKGYDVTIVVYKKSYPLLGQAGNFKIIECETEELKELDYEIIFIQHFPVFDYLCSRYHLTYHKLIVSKLSVISELEELPACTCDADLILCVSQECADSVREKIGDDGRIRVFKNSVSREFFESFESKAKPGQIPKRAAVVSNHVPPELTELREEMAERAGLSLEYIGMGNVPRLVTAKVLKEYDLVITIGRTVQQCFAAGVPVYVYDYFGGPGYITRDNFETAEKYNFSGRGFAQLTAEELAEDILDNYEEALWHLEEFHETALDRYNYDKEFDGILKELYKCASEVRKADYYTDIERARLSLYSKVLPLLLKPNQRSQIYYDTGGGFCEENSVTWNSVENYQIHKTVNLNGPVRRLRFDPCDTFCRYHIYELKVNGKVKTAEREEVCLTSDPQLEISLSDMKGYLSGEETGNHLSGKDAENYLSGEETEGYLAGEETEGYLAGEETEGYLAGEETEGQLRIEISYSYSVLGIEDVLDITDRKFQSLEESYARLKVENEGLRSENAGFKRKKIYRLKRKIKRDIGKVALKKSCLK